MKKLFICGLATVFLLAGGGHVQAAPAENVYEAIVKINVYAEDELFNLQPLKSGSGVIISNDGLVLTNHHVVDLTDDFGNELPVAMQVCLTTETGSAPSCLYGADLVSKDEDTDMALIRIRNTQLSSKNFFDYLERASGEDIQEGDEVQAFGYPGAGGNTISISSGTITGTLEQNSVSWIKNSAVTSFGSSGGALVDAQGKLLGITSAAIDDFNYAINIGSVKNWINSYLIASSVSSSVQSRLEDLMVKNEELQSTQTFINSSPHIEFTKPYNWGFAFSAENELVALNLTEDDPGYIALTWLSAEAEVFSGLDKMYNSLLLATDCIGLGGVTFAGKSAYEQLCISDDQEESKLLLLGSDNYIILISYYYGGANASQAEVDEILSSFQITDSGNFAEQRVLENSDPYFKINLPEGWALKKLNSFSPLVTGAYLNNRQFDFNFHVIQIPPSMQTVSSQAYYDYIKDDEQAKNSHEEYLGLSAERYFHSTDFAINSLIENQILIKYKYKDDENNYPYYSASYIIRSSDKAFIIDINYLGEDQAVFEQVLEVFQNQVLGNFSLNPGEVPAPVQSENQEIVEPAETVEPEETEPVMEEQLAEPAEEAEAEPAGEAATAEPVIEVVVLPVVLETKEIKNIGKRNMGKIVLEVENRGKAWYLSSKTNRAYFLGRAEDAYQIMREQGIGITNQDLQKIPIGIMSVVDGDTDGDGLYDLLEDALGTDREKVDTDGDGYNDKIEVEHGYIPTDPNGKQGVDAAFAEKQKGKIFLQVEKRGEAWYVNPADGKRYFLGRAEDAYQIMRNLGLGISAGDFSKL